MNGNKLPDVIRELDAGLAVEKGGIKVQDAHRLRSRIPQLAEMSALETGLRQGWAQYAIRAAAQNLGIYPASISDLYMARGRGDVPATFTVPAVNLRVLSFDAARAVFRAAKALDAAAMIFEIARSEMGYTNQRPNEYASSILAAAIAEDYKGPVFIQGDHFQVSPKRYAANPDQELDALKALMRESVAAGFYNIDVDTSTMVDLSQTSLEAQQEQNTSLSAMFTCYIREIEPKGVTISVGGEIGEVGGHNSTEAELRAYLDGYKAKLGCDGGVGLSKISIQTGTSHGGVVLPDGSIAQVNVDFGTLLHLSRVARQDYGLGGAVQHGASTLPEDAFSKFVESEACEVHLATNFMNMFFDNCPPVLKADMYAYLREKSASERKPDMTDEQFYYKTRKNVIGPFKAQSWGMPTDTRERLGQAWEAQFKKLFTLLGLEGTRIYVEQTVRPEIIPPDARDYLGEAVETEEVSDLAD